MELCVFTKHFAGYDARNLGKVMADLGVDGVDLTVREKGHVEPGKVKAQLPEFQKGLSENDIKISMLTTGITDAKNPHTRAIIETAGKLGIKYVKLGYWKYAGFGHLKEQEQAARKDLKALEPIFRDNGVRAGFHTHSWLFLGINAIYALRLLDDRDPAVMGIYYDTGHEGLEGALRGWEMDLDLAMDRIIMVAVKNMGLYPLDNDRLNGWDWRVVPLDEGLSDIAAMTGILKKAGYDGLYSFHSEYQGRFSQKDMDQEEVVAQTGKDIGYFKKIMNSG